MARALQSVAALIDLLLVLLFQSLIIVAASRLQSPRREGMTSYRDSTTGSRACDKICFSEQTIFQSVNTMSML